VNYTRLRQRILDTYRQDYIRPLFGDDGSVPQQLLSGLDALLCRELGIDNFHDVQPREVSDKFQISTTELSTLRFPDPYEVLKMDELRAMYGGLGSRIRRFCPSDNQTVANLQTHLLKYRRSKPSERRGIFHGIGPKTLRCMEDYLIFKASKPTQISQF
jgi:hypothetical protein